MEEELRISEDVTEEEINSLPSHSYEDENTSELSL